MIVPQVMSYGLGSAGSSAVAGAGGTISSIGLVTANPVMIAVGGLVALGASIAGALHVGEGCGPTCIQATNIVNSAEPTFKMNVTAYQQGQIDQATALNNFNQMWLAIQQACGGIPGTAGQNCVGDRQEGACKWKDASGQCWNWFTGYRDPLLQPSSVPYQGASTSGITSAISSIFGGSNILVIGGLLVGMGLLLASD